MQTYELRTNTNMDTQDRFKNYYEILELPYDCSFEHVHEGYQRAKNAYSGDSVALYSLITKQECDEMLDLIETAYSVLSIPQKRKEYDRVKNISPSIFDQLKNNISHQHQHQHQHQQPGKDQNASSFSSITNNSDNLSSEPTKVFTNQKSSFNFSSYEDSNSNSNGAHDDHFKINRNEVEISKLAANSRFRLDFERNPSFEQEIENATIFTGAFLKKIREYKNISVDRMADLTKISRTYILCMENDETDKLPALAYIRGFVYQYAKVLKLSADLVATSYINHLKGLQKKNRGGMY